ncbi:MAG TPA: DNA recombination protein RmuC [Terrimicrobiaceae bacterium]|nr:DNA recombination protein RmuC [Terrimicrobiaceae bacterium]
MIEILLAVWIVLVLAAGVVLVLALRASRAAHRSAAEAPQQVREAFAALTAQIRQDDSAGRQELAQALFAALGQSSETTRNALRTQTEAITGLREALDRQLAHLAQTNEQKLEAVRVTLESRLTAIQHDNNARLDQMRATVEEKLQSTLERRLGESFKMVSDNLQQVHAAMGEMRKLAGEVGSLQTLMSNVKNRGGWGEFQLAAILEQFLSPEQYAKNVQPGGKGEIVEFAIKLPGRDGEGSVVWLPIDAKFPKEDYEKLIAAMDRQDADQIKVSSGQLESRIKGNARDISQKYLHPPKTTDFAIMFLPTEGLYAEVLRRPGLADFIQREHRVVIAGPTTLVALLNSLQIGFRTLAIEKQSSEVWKVLGAVKAQFGTFGEILAKVQKKLQSATSDIEAVGVKTQTMQRKLRAVENVSVEDSDDVFGFSASGDGDSEGLPAPVPQSERTGPGSAA